MKTRRWGNYLVHKRKIFICNGKKIAGCFIKWSLLNWLSNWAADQGDSQLLPPPTFRTQTWIKQNNLPPQAELLPPSKKTKEQGWKSLNALFKRFLNKSVPSLNLKYNQNEWKTWSNLIRLSWSEGADWVDWVNGWCRRMKAHNSTLDMQRV